MKLARLLVGFWVIILVAGVAYASNPVLDASGAPDLSAQKLVQAVPNWLQVNSNGFGDPLTREVSALVAFNGFLYAGTYNLIDPLPLFDGAQIFRSQDGITWTPVTQPGFGIAHDIMPPAILDMTVFNEQIYASTGLGDGPGQIWRALDGENWAPMVIHGFSDPDIVNITALAEYDGLLYAGATHLVDGAQIWRSYTGDSNSWTQVAPVVPGTSAASITGLAVFDGALYAVVESEAPAQIWRSYGGDWTTVMDNGFGDNQTVFTGGMVAHAGYLYVGAGNTADGAQLWRTNDGDTWEPVNNPGFNDPNNLKVDIVYVFQNSLYISMKNVQTGIELWRWTNGTTWEQVNLDGFSDANNAGSNWSNAATEFLGHLYIGTSNISTGGELWRMQQKYFYIPLALR